PSVYAIVIGGEHYPWVTGENEAMIIDGFVHQLPDVDPEETQEWLDSLTAVVEAQGKTRARFLMSKLLERAASCRSVTPPPSAPRTSTRSRPNRSRGSRATS